VWKEADLQQDVLVRPDGKFTFPLAGEVNARGRSVEEIREELVEKITAFIPDPVVTVQMQQTTGNVIFVLGKVTRPGQFVMSRNMDIMQALAVAGGTATFAALGKIKVLRRSGGQLSAIPFEYDEIEKGRELDQNILLQPGDVIVVP
jgi:polysaccharide biosynthesis/export protein